MTVICIGYFDKFSRFFLDIRQHLRKNHKSSINFKILSIHFSGFLYTLIRLKYSSWIALKAWYLASRKRKYYAKIIAQSNTYKGLKYDDYISFHIGLNKNINPNKLRLQALAYIDIFDKIYTSEKPDYVLTIGDSRLSIEVAIALAKQKHIKVCYIEQGPFNTTFFDDEGANANLSIRNKADFNLDDKTFINSENRIHSKTEKYNRSPIYRGLDLIFTKFFENTRLYPPDLKYTDVMSYLFKKNKTTLGNKNKHSSKSIILLILQIPFDVNMIKHSPLFNSHAEIIRHVYSNLPENTQLIVREHPLYIANYEAVMYNFIRENKIEIDNYIPLNKALDLAKVVIVNNSTVGVEALLKYKTVVILGNAFYDNENICFKLKHKDELGTVIEKSLNYTPNKKQIDNFRHLLYNTVLLKGGIADKDLISSKQIANYLITHQ